MQHVYWVCLLQRRNRSMRRWQRVLPGHILARINFLRFRWSCWFRQACSRRLCFYYGIHRWTIVGQIWLLPHRYLWLQLHWSREFCRNWLLWYQRNLHYGCQFKRRVWCMGTPNYFWLNRYHQSWPIYQQRFSFKIWIPWSRHPHRSLDSIQG